MRGVNRVQAPEATRPDGRGHRERTQRLRPRRWRWIEPAVSQGSLHQLSADRDGRDGVLPWSVSQLRKGARSIATIGRKSNPTDFIQIRRTGCCLLRVCARACVYARERDRDQAQANHFWYTDMLTVIRSGSVDSPLCVHMIVCTHVNKRVIGMHSCISSRNSGRWTHHCCSPTTSRLRGHDCWKSL